MRAASEGIGENAFELVCSSNGFFVWIAEPEKVFRQVYRVLKPGGYYIFYDVHPFLRPWKDQVSPLEMEGPYTATGPFIEEDGQVNYQFHWRMSDLLNPLLAAGLLAPDREITGEGRTLLGGYGLPARRGPGFAGLAEDPRAGLPAWLTVAAQKQYAAQESVEEQKPGDRK